MVKLNKNALSNSWILLAAILLIGVLGSFYQNSSVEVIISRCLILLFQYLKNLLSEEFKKQSVYILREERSFKRQLICL